MTKNAATKVYLHNEAVVQGMQQLQGSGPKRPNQVQGERYSQEQKRQQELHRLDF